MLPFQTVDGSRGDFSYNLLIVCSCADGSLSFVHFDKETNRYLPGVEVNRDQRNKQKLLVCIQTYPSMVIASLRELSRPLLPKFGDIGFVYPGSQLKWQ
jgi:hypothetical protein